MSFLSDFFHARPIFDPCFRSCSEPVLCAFPAAAADPYARFGAYALFLLVRADADAGVDAGDGAYARACAHGHDCADAHVCDDDDAGIQSVKCDHCHRKPHQSLPQRVVVEVDVVWAERRARPVSPAVVNYLTAFEASLSSPSQE